MPTDRGEPRMETYRPETKGSIQHPCPPKGINDADYQVEFSFHPDRYRDPGRPFTNDSLSEFPCIALHRKCFTMMQRMVDHRQSLTRHGLPVDGPLSLEDFWRVFRSRLDNTGMMSHWGGVYQPMILEPHEYFFQPAYGLIDCYLWPTGGCEVIVGAPRQSLVPSPIIRIC